MIEEDILDAIWNEFSDQNDGRSETMTKDQFEKAANKLIVIMQARSEKSLNNLIDRVESEITDLRTIAFFEKTGTEEK